MMTEPMVSVLMITYNHERYIAQAIESVLMQRTDFAVELVIGEDCSTDGTRDIVRNYAGRFPDRIRPLLQQSNQGMMANFLATRHLCTGSYVALLEGDDYWTDPSKLQLQVDYLESHAGCALCFHNVLPIRDDEEGASRLYCRSDQKEASTLEDLLWKDYIPTCSVVYRRGLLGELPSWYGTMPVGDWPHYVLLAEHGYLGYLDTAMAVYREHAKGAYTGRSYDLRFADVMQMYDVFDEYFHGRFSGLISAARCEHMAELIVEKAKATDTFQDGIAMSGRTLAEWQTRYSLQDSCVRKALGRVYAYYLFSSRTGQIDGPAARRCLKGLVRSDPSWLSNAGVWSLAADALLGRGLAGWLRRSPGVRRNQAQAGRR